MMKHEIFQLLHDDSAGKLTLEGFAEQFYENKFEKYTLVLAGISVLLFVFTAFYPPTKLIAQISALIFIVSIFAHTISSSVKSFKSFFWPVPSFLRDLDKKVEKETRLLEILTTKDPQDLGKTRERLLAESERLRSSTQFLVGIIEKAGIIPTAAALYYTYIKTATNDSMYVLAFMVGIYAAAFASKRVILWIENVAFILKIAEEKAITFRALAGAWQHMNESTEFCAPPPPTVPSTTQQKAL